MKTKQITKLLPISEEIRRMELAIKKGYIYNSETGNVVNKKGNLLTNKTTKGYSRFVVYENDRKGFPLMQHRFAWYFHYKEVPKIIDHINLVRTDNRITNLRSVTEQENNFNTIAKGVSFNKVVNKWCARIMLDKKPIHIGYFCDKNEAEKAYLEFKNSLHKFNNNEKEIIDLKKYYYKGNGKHPKNIHWVENMNKYCISKSIKGKRTYFGYYVNIEDAILKLNELKENNII